MRILFTILCVVLGANLMAQNKLSKGVIYAWGNNEITHPITLEFQDTITAFEFKLSGHYQRFQFDEAYVGGSLKDATIHTSHTTLGVNEQLHVIVEFPEGLSPGVYENELFFKGFLHSSNIGNHLLYIQNVILTDKDLSNLNGTGSNEYFYITNYTTSYPRPTISTAATLEGIRVNVGKGNISDEVAFDILRQGPEDDYHKLITRTTSLSYIDRDVNPGETYAYVVRVHRSDGSVAYTTQNTKEALPELPSRVEYFVGTSPASNRMDLRMVKPDGSSVTSYRLKYGTDRENLGTTINNITASTSSDTTNHQVTGLSGNTLYYFQVEGVNSAGVGEPSDIISAKTLPTVPTAPTFSSVTPLSDYNILVEFNDRSDNEDGFILSRSLSTQTTYITLDTLPPNSTSYLDQGLASNTGYTYRISAYNEGGESSKTQGGNYTTRQIEFELGDVDAYSDFQIVRVPLLIRSVSVIDSVKGVNQKIALKNDEAEVVEIIPHSDFFPDDVKIEFTHTNDTLSYFIRIEGDHALSRFNSADTLFDLRMTKSVSFNDGTINMSAGDMTFSYNDYSISSRCNDGSITVEQRDDRIFKQYQVFYFDPLNNSYEQLLNTNVKTIVQGLEDNFGATSQPINQDADDDTYAVASFYKGVSFSRVSKVPYYDMVRYKGSHEVFLIEQAVLTDILNSKSLEELMAYDVNLDGEVTLADAILLDQYTKGLASIEDWKFYETNASELATTNQFFLDRNYDKTDSIRAIFNGDVDYSFIPSLDSRNARSASSENIGTVIFEVVDESFINVYLDDAFEGHFHTLDLNIAMSEIQVTNHVFDEDKFYTGNAEGLMLIRSRSNEALPKGRHNPLISFEIEDMDSDWVKILLVDGQEVPFGIERVDAVLSTTLESISMAVYPNPVENTLTVKIGDQAVGEVRLWVYDNAGKIMISTTTNTRQEFELDVSGLQSGIYSIKLIDEEKSSTYYRIIKR